MEGGGDGWGGGGVSDWLPLILVGWLFTDDKKTNTCVLLSSRCLNALGKSIVTESQFVK
jgi:hypothetical protein